MPFSVNVLVQCCLAWSYFHPIDETPSLTSSLNLTDTVTSLAGVSLSNLTYSTFGAFFIDIIDCKLLCSFVAS